MAATYRGDFDLEDEFYEQQSLPHSENSDESAPGEEENLESDDAEGVIEGTKLDESSSVKGLGQGKSGARKTKKGNGKPGRKAKWTDECTDDLVDIICNNEVYKKRIIFTNIKTSKNSGYYEKIVKELKERCARRGESFSYDVNQTREKFKRLIAECKKAALIMKTASGIKRFQEDKGYGKWFNCLLPLVQTRASCQPEQAIDPGSVLKKKRKREEESDVSSPSTNNDSSSIDGKNDDESNLFVPVKGGKKKPAKMAQMEDSLKDVLGKVAESLNADPTDKLLKYFEQENERARQHEMKLFAMLFGGQTSQQVAPSAPPTMEFQGNGFQKSASQWQTVPQNWNMGRGTYSQLLSQPENLDRSDKQHERDNLYEQLF